MTHRLDPTFLGSNLESKSFNPSQVQGGAQAVQTDKTVLWAEPRRLAQPRLCSLRECTQPFDRVLEEVFGRDFVRVFGFGLRLWLRLGILYGVRLLRRV
jgi:hypothetical protein